jgi:tRNA U38,U39,U40 pseudouridine synthase TruA
MIAGAASDDAGECQAGEQPAAPDVDVALVHALLQPLVGRALDYHAYARDTPPGKPCECTLSQARALVVALPSGQRQTQCLCVELVGDRFLRRMVRVLVATAVREAVALQLSGGTDVERLVALAAAKDRLLTAVPAPSGGLCLAAVGH